MTKQFTGNISRVSDQINAVVMAIAGAGRIFELLDEQPEIDDGDVTLVRCRKNADGSLTECAERTGTWAWKDGDKLIPMRGKINLKEVDFGYNEDELVLHDITIYAEPGQKVALVGATGAGKTTITNLINRFYDIQDGKIRYDGININKIKKADLRRSLGIVLQDTHLFTGTVMENIRYGKENASHEELNQATDVAQAKEFIESKEERYDSHLAEGGSNLSGGQKQRLSIARAVVKRPDLYIFDDSFSALDYKTDATLRRRLKEVTQDATVLIVAQRVGTIMDADQIIVLDKGEIVGRGRHEELMESNEIYREIANSQLNQKSLTED